HIMVHPVALLSGGPDWLPGQFLAFRAVAMRSPADTHQPTMAVYPNSRCRASVPLSASTRLGMAALGARPWQTRSRSAEAAVPVRAASTCRPAPAGAIRWLL